jgi:hypothetical protein
MQTFTPTQLHQNPAKVFRAADKDGSVLIKHDRYPDTEFVLMAKDKKEGSNKTSAADICRDESFWQRTEAIRKRNYEASLDIEAHAHGVAVMEKDNINDY